MERVYHRLRKDDGRRSPEESQRGLRGDALSFTEAEARIIEQMSAYISGAFEVYNINPAVYGEIFFSDDELADRWYKAKLQFITLDEKTDKEKRSNVYYLVQAGTFEQARKNIDEVMGATMIDYVIAKLEETKIQDVFVYKPKQDSDSKQIEE